MFSAITHLFTPSACGSLQTGVPRVGLSLYPKLPEVGVGCEEAGLPPCKSTLALTGSFFP